VFGRLRGELGVPPAAKSDPASRELARVWAIHGEQHVVLRPEAWGEDAAPWGILLVDLARHIARAHEQLYGHPQAESLSRIRQLFDAEWQAPTDVPRGTIS
jgi:Domain of unknown function (DUF5076)